MKNELIIALVIFLAALVIKLAFDYHLWLSGKPNRHTLGAFLVFVVLVGCSFLAGFKSVPMFFFGWTCLFDPFYSILIGQHWTYIGQTATLDKLQRKYPILQTLKYLFFIGAILFFIL